MSGMITKPPPNESAPTLSAVQASAPRPPWATTAKGAMTGRRVAAPPWGRTSSPAPQPTSTRARDGPGDTPPAGAAGRAGPAARAPDPQRRGLPEQDGRQSDDGDDRRDDEAQAADDRARRA